MGRFQFRRSWSIGPFRFTLSRSGLSVSIGGRALRVTRSPGGRKRTTIGTPFRGLTYQHVHGSRRRGGLSAATWPYVVGALAVGWLVVEATRPIRGWAKLTVLCGVAGLILLAWNPARDLLLTLAARREPPPRPIATPRVAELMAAEWLAHLGFVDAEPTGQGPDGGLDVVASGAVAQVKATADKVGRPVLQQTMGAALGRRVAVFSMGGFTPQALTWADEHNLALFAFTPNGVVTAVSDTANSWVRAARLRSR